MLRVNQWTLFDPESYYLQIISQKLQNPSSHSTELEQYAELIRKLRLSSKESNLNGGDYGSNSNKVKSCKVKYLKKSVIKETAVQ
jgi:hypothetical protein